MLRPERCLDDGVLGSALGFNPESLEGRAGDDRGVVSQVASDVQTSKSVVPGHGGDLGGLAGSDARCLSGNTGRDVGNGRGDVGRLVEGLDDDGVRRRWRRRRGARVAEEPGRCRERQSGRCEGEGAQRRGQGRGEERAFPVRRGLDRRPQGQRRRRRVWRRDQVEVVAEVERVFSAGQRRQRRGRRCRRRCRRRLLFSFFWKALPSVVLSVLW